MIKVGIIGGAGYTGGELFRILMYHPDTEIVYIHSKSHSGKKIHEVHTDLYGDTEMVFSDSFDAQVDVIFLCLGHGESKKFLEENHIKLSSSAKIIDLSQDFRSETNEFVYGLPELKRQLIRKATKVANPGCFATAIQLALLPLAKEKLLHDDIHVHATTGSTGAGQSLTDTVHFSWRTNNLSIYKAFEHQHLREIKQSLVYMQPDYNSEIHFIPVRGNFTRGILATVYTHFDGTVEDAFALYHDYYDSHPFTHVLHDSISLKQVINTNKCFLHIEKHGKKLLITSAEDNLLKGASGQAVQNMNLLFGLDETKGLKLKPVAF